MKYNNKTKKKNIFEQINVATKKEYLIMRIWRKVNEQQTVFVVVVVVVYVRQRSCWNMTNFCSEFHKDVNMAYGNTCHNRIIKNNNNKNTTTTAIYNIKHSKNWRWPPSVCAAVSHSGRQLRLSNVRCCHNCCQTASEPPTNTYTHTSISKETERYEMYCNASDRILSK